MVDMCCMCKMNEESVNYLLLHCEFFGALYDVFFSKIWAVLSYQVVDLYACW